MRELGIKCQENDPGRYSNSYEGPKDHSTFLSKIRSLLYVPGTNVGHNDWVTDVQNYSPLFFLGVTVTLDIGNHKSYTVVMNPDKLSHKNSCRRSE